MSSPNNTSTTHLESHKTPLASGPGKVKQTRRRKRLSCVECTRRRQKCDRQIPCGLCVSRGIPQLCRWEPMVSRPAPQRPPEGAPDAPQQSTIAALSARIAALEQNIVQQNLRLPSSDGRSHAEELSTTNNSPFPGDLSILDQSSQSIVTLHEHTAESSSSPDTDCCREKSPSECPDYAELSHYQFDVQLAAGQMAQLSLAPSDEYVGSGTVVCAIHKLGDSKNYRYPYARSSTTMFSNTSQPDSSPLTVPIKRLLQSLPSRETVDMLVKACFTERIWQFGIPERWFKMALQRMWVVLESHCPGRLCHETGGCVRCTQEINPHWLSLLFSVLAIAPRRFVGTNARVYFWKAIEARRLVDEFTLCSPAYSSAPTQCVVHGVSISCMATAILAAYLADRGRVSDAWKLTGNALRNAQAVGLHRDPGWTKWEKMDKQECELRLLAWWFLIMSDRLYSLILGRPTMANQETSDVKLVPGKLHGDGTENPFAQYQRSFVALMNIVDEIVTKCLGISTPSYATVLDMDRKLKHWLSKLHPSLDWRIPHHLSSTASRLEQSIAYQRHICAAYYLSTLMNLHRPYLMKAPPILPPPRGLSAVTSVIMNPSRERCIETAMELVSILCDAHEEAAQWDAEPAIPPVIFHYAYCVFDGAVALVGALTQDPPHPKAKECLTLIDRATRMLEACKGANKGATEGEGATASRAITVLAALRKAGRWDERFGEYGSHGVRMPDTSPMFSPLDSGPSHTTATLTPGASSAGLVSSTDSKNTWSLNANPFLNSSTMPIAGPSTFADLAGLNSEFAPTPLMGASFPFLSAFRSAPSFPMPGPIQVQSSALMPAPFGDTRDTNLDSMAAPIVDYGGITNAAKPSMQTMVMPFDMLQNSDSYDIDWAMGMGPSGWAGGSANRDGRP